MKTNLKKLALNYMENVRIMALATCSNKKPWASTVFYAYDKKFNLYFLSRYHRRHSFEIRKNPNVAGTIVKPQKIFSAPNTGMQFEGAAKMLMGKELEAAYKIFVKRYPAAEKIIKSASVLGSGEIRMYKITPRLLVMQDQKKFPKEQRAIVLEK
ncbi:MAG: pyridoxamine 5'-phosphate oxidase family protein [Candidatus Aenigmarchaeota archaeon]|nr:pyridoxamine 5'-phosphate oxidase family protein [Candidatus Aenigmarchaeota archaeon]